MNEHTQTIPQDIMDALQDFARVQGRPWKRLLNDIMKEVIDWKWLENET
jgi:hypothetical protein